MVCWWVLIHCGQHGHWHRLHLEWGLRNNIWVANGTVFQFLWGGTFGEFCPKKGWNYTEKRKNRFFQISQTRKKLGSESTDFLFRFFNCLRIWRIFPHSLKKKTQLSYICKFFTKTYCKIEKHSPQKKTVEAILPKARPILV